MTRRRPTAKKFEFKGFENLSFSSSQKREIIAWQDSMQSDPLDAITVLTEVGYKVSFGYDDYHGVLQTALTCKDVASKYCGWCFTLTHAEPERALYILRWFYDSWLATELYEVADESDRYSW